MSSENSVCICVESNCKILKRRARMFSSSKRNPESLIFWKLSASFEERLEMNCQNINSIGELRRGSCLNSYHLRGEFYIWIFGRWFAHFQEGSGRCVIMNIWLRFSMVYRRSYSFCNQKTPIEIEGYRIKWRIFRVSTNPRYFSTKRSFLKNQSTNETNFRRINL